MNVQSQLHYLAQAMMSWVSISHQRISMKNHQRVKQITKACDLRYYIIADMQMQSQLQYLAQSMTSWVRISH